MAEATTQDQTTPDTSADAKAPDTTAEKPKDAEKQKEGPKPKGEAKATTAKKVERIAKTHVKYAGAWYSPGEPVPFKAAEDAEPYDAEGALEPEK